MNVSSVGTGPYVHNPATGHKPAATPTTGVAPLTAAPVDADGDRDRDTAAGDRLDLRG